VPPRSQRERDEDARKEKLENVEAQVSSGSLRVREMTDEERAKWGPAAPPSDAPKRRPRGGR
jgi:hypothetical protein